jgi:hypothetical protein
MNQPKIFLEALFTGKPEEFYLLIWTLQGDHKHSRWFLDVQQAVEYVDLLRGCNVYVGIGLSPDDFGASRRCVVDDIAGIVGMWADIDIRSEAYPRRLYQAPMSRRSRSVSGID